MEKEDTENRSKAVLAVILIVVGIFWLLGQLNLHFHLDTIFRPFVNLFGQVGKVLFSWPMILVVVGLLLVAGNRQGGWILVVLGGIFLLPKIFLFPGFSLSLVLPALLIIAGIVLLVRKV